MQRQMFAVPWFNVFFHKWPCRATKNTLVRVAEQRTGGVQEQEQAQEQEDLTTG